MTRKFKALTISVLSLVLVTGVAFGAHAANRRIAVVLSDLSATYTAWLAEAFNLEAEKYPQYDITILDSRWDVATQIGHLENCIAQGYDLVMVQSVDPHALAGQINLVIDAGIPVITVNCPNTDAPRASSVLADPVQQGKIPAMVAREMLPQNAKVVVMLGPAGNYDSIGRRQGFQEELFDKRPDITILDETIANWMKDQGMALMENWLQRFPEIDAVISMNDGMALGAIEAAKAVGRMEEMLYFGIDGIPETCLSIKKGEFTATTLQNANGQAEDAMALAHRILSGEVEQEIVISEAELIDASNVDYWIEVHKKNGNWIE